MTPEGRVLAEVTKFLNSVPGVRVSRNHSGMTRGYKRYGCFSPGGSDIIGWMEDSHFNREEGSLRFARFLAIEVKQPGEKPTPDQARFIAEVREAGGIAGCVSSVAECARLLGMEPPA